MNKNQKILIYYTDLALNLFIFQDIIHKRKDRASLNSQFKEDLSNSRRS